MIGYKEHPPKNPEDVYILESASIILARAIVEMQKARRDENDIRKAHATGVLYAHGVSIGAEIMEVVQQPERVSNGEFSDPLLNAIRKIAIDDDCYKVIRAGFGNGVSIGEMVITEAKAAT